MSTSTLVQYLEAGVGAVSNRRETETFIASETIAAKDALALDFSKTDDGDKVLFVKQLDSANAAASCFVGVALNGGAAGSKIEAVIKGPVEANVAGTTAQGNALEASATKGQLAPYANTSVAVIAGIATEADTANVATVVVKKQF